MGEIGVEEDVPEPLHEMAEAAAKTQPATNELREIASRIFTEAAGNRSRTRFDHA